MGALRRGSGGVEISMRSGDGDAEDSEPGVAGDDDDDDEDDADDDASGDAAIGNSGTA